MIRRPPRSTLSSSSAASDVYKRQLLDLRDDLRGHPDLRRDPGIPQPAGPVVPHGPGHRHPAHQRRVDLAVYPVLPFLPAHHGRQAQAFLPPPCPLLDVATDLEAERPAHAAGLGVAGLAGRRRPLHHPSGARHHQRPSLLLTAMEALTACPTTRNTGTT